MQETNKELWVLNMRKSQIPRPLSKKQIDSLIERDIGPIPPPIPKLNPEDLLRLLNKLHADHLITDEQLNTARNEVIRKHNG